MKKRTVLKSAVVTLGLCAGTLIADAQSAGGAAGAGGSGGVGTAGASGAGAATGTAGGRVGSGSVISGRSAATTAAQPNGVTTSRSQVGGNAAGTTVAPANQTTAGNLNTVGPGSILQPAANSAIGGASVIGSTPAAQNPSIANASLPAAVRSTLQGFNANGGVQQVSQVTGQNGPAYQATIMQNGVPMQLQISPSGQILSRTPLSNLSTVSAGNAAAGAAAFGNLQAGLPLSALPPAVQNAISTQLGT